MAKSQARADVALLAVRRAKQAALLWLRLVVLDCVRCLVPLLVRLLVPLLVRSLVPLLLRPRVPLFVRLRVPLLFGISFEPLRPAGRWVVSIGLPKLRVYKRVYFFQWWLCFDFFLVAPPLFARLPLHPLPFPPVRLCGPLKKVLSMASGGPAGLCSSRGLRPEIFKN